MKIPFWKMHGAANDFILVDDRKKRFPATDREWITQIAARRTGVGCEGVILIEPSDKADFRMRFFNPDGGEVEMCGNGARCAAKLAHQIGAATARMTIETMAGILHAEVLNHRVRLHMTEPKHWRMDQKITLEGIEYVYHFVDTGVPHAVVPVEDLEAVDVKRLGALIRYHDDFKPMGTNADFFMATGTHELRIRTYERGVEDETLACGTGIVAAALIAGRSGRVKPPVQVIAASGDVLEVDYRVTEAGATHVTLTGPAIHVYHGIIDHP
ncbi:MAG: diaminopimelate epimerase [Kiritimatiellae bacterium]|nr:diaminopimelate epimerase [Kiritimatiellia bacterium]